jgi:hypothetical protein
MQGKKIKLLEHLAESEVLRFLPGKALKAYLILLVAARRIGREETICRKTLRRGLGHRLTRRQLESIGAALQRHGLAVVRPVPPAGESSIRGDTVYFRLLGQGDG